MLLGWGSFRAAEGLLKKVKKLFGESRGKNEAMEKDLQEKLADYQNKVDDAWDLLREATDKIREANLLSAENQKNMTALEVSFRGFFIWIWEHVGEGGGVDPDKVSQSDAHLGGQVWQLWKETSKK